MILIHGAPGARLGFINAFLTDSLAPEMYDVGITRPFIKHHTYNEHSIRNFAGKKIYMQLSNELLWLHLFLFLEKNLLPQDPQYKQYDYTHRMLFDKFYYSCKMWFEDENITNTSLYDYVIPFEKTYNIDYLIELYRDFNGNYPSDNLLKSVESTNLKNFPRVPENHNVRVSASVFNFEYQNNLQEEHRLWAINDIAPFDHNSGVCLDPDNILKNITSKLNKENYSQCY